MSNVPARHTSMDQPTEVHIYFTVGAHHEEAIFQSNTPPEQIKDLFRAAAEASPRDILKLYSATGQLVNICAGLEGNTPALRYSLQVVAAHGCAMLEEGTAAHLQALEARVADIERLLKADDLLPLPGAVQHLQAQVDGFREKLETTETLSWLGFYKQLPEPLSTEECRRLRYRRKSDSIKKRVKQNFLNICDAQVSDSVRDWLRMPTFDSTQWEDEELLLLLQQMYLDFDLCSKFAINIETLRNFLYEAYKNYNEVPFHNFRHCFCVAQMMYAICYCVDLPSKIGDLEVLILLTSCICHDLDHPGYNNIYQINAKTELALRYNDISPLENHHCSVAFRLLENEDCNLFKSFDAETFKTIREGMIRSILATDMARHNEILSQFRETIPEFDYDNKVHVNLLCMVLIKVSDISNEARPMDVAEPWLDKLLQEFFKQSDAEKLEGLPVTPFMDREKITKPSSQCSFIGFVLLPLFETLGELLTELQDLIVQPVRDALDYYRRLNEATKEERLQRKSIVAELAAGAGDQLPSPGNSLTKSSSSLRLKKSLSFQTNKSRSRSTEEDMVDETQSPTGEDPSQPSTNLADVVEDPESSSSSGGDSEAAVTEVDVSEKTLKFKISTEGNAPSNNNNNNNSNAGRKSYPGSRKGSRERVVHNLDLHTTTTTTRGGKLKTAALSFDQQTHYARKKLPFEPPEFLDEYLLSHKFDCSLIGGGGGGAEDEDKVCKMSKRNSDVSEEDSPLRRKSFLMKTLMRQSSLGRSDESPVVVKQPLEPVETIAETTKNGRSLLSRFKMFTDRLGLSLDRETSTNTASNKESKGANNASRMMTLPALRKKKLESAAGCKSLESGVEEGETHGRKWTSSTLPKMKRNHNATAGGGVTHKKHWKFFLLGKHHHKGGSGGGGGGGGNSDVVTDSSAGGGLEEEGEMKTIDLSGGMEREKEGKELGASTSHLDTNSKAGGEHQTAILTPDGGLCCRRPPPTTTTIVPPLLAGGKSPLMGNSLLLEGVLPTIASPVGPLRGASPTDVI